MTPEPIRRWHEIVRSRDLAGLSDLLDADVVFESPVVFSPQKGRAITTKYLQGALHVLNGPDFKYVGEWHSERSSVLEFETKVDGLYVNGVDLIFWNAAGKITRFKVMARPLQAINALHQKMAAMLSKMS
jgi:hypothetical protein